VKRTVAALAALVFLVTAACDRADVRPRPPDVSVRTIRAYRVVYRVESGNGGSRSVSTDRLLVRRPFDARLESFAGRPPGDRRLSTTITSFARLRVQGATFAVAPTAPGADLRLDAFLRDALADGYTLRRARKRVAGRSCRVYRVAAVTGAESLGRVARAGDDYEELCVDADGLVLERDSFADGERVGRRRATSVSEDPDITEPSFHTGDPTAGVRDGGGSVQELAPTSKVPGDVFWELRGLLKGFRKRGRYAVIPPQAGFKDPLERAGIVTFVSEVWTRGPDVVVIEQGSARSGRPPFAADRNARKVSLGALGSGELRYGLSGSEVRARTGGGRFVRVSGTVPPSKLLAIARMLRKTEGGPLILSKKG
jgi:hypothetical protein